MITVRREVLAALIFINRDLFKQAERALGRQASLSVGAIAVPERSCLLAGRDGEALPS
jgi:hypothetical protein